MTTPPPNPDSITFSYDATTRLRTAVITGVLIDEALIGAYGALVQQPEYDVGADDLVDMREVTHMGVSGGGLRRLMELFAEIDHLGVPTRLAIVAPTDAVYGVSRMYEMLRGDGVPEEIRVFRDMGSANAWLADGRDQRGHTSRHSAA